MVQGRDRCECGNDEEVADLVAGEGIWPAGAGARACSTAAVTVRNAWASSPRVAQQCQEVQVRT
jgi:hypothetical protein